MATSPGEDEEKNMERFAALFEHLELRELSKVLRWTVFATIGFGLIALVLLSVFGYVPAGWGACIGLGLGLLNIRSVMSKASRLDASSIAKSARPLALNTFGRLGMTTVVTVGLVLLSVQLGIGVVAGIAAFYLFFVVSLVIMLLHQGAVT
jgi:hypothetical protein